MSIHQYLAFDLGAESGRAVLGTLKEKRLVMQELHRFPNNILQISGHSHWNIPQLFTEILKGLRICSSKKDTKIESIAIDTWGADFTFCRLPHEPHTPVPRAREVEAQRLALAPFEHGGALKGEALRRALAGLEAEPVGSRPPSSLSRNRA